MYLHTFYQTNAYS